LEGLLSDFYDKKINHLSTPLHPFLCRIFIAMPIVRDYSITDLKDEVRALVARGSVHRQHRIYELSKHFSDRKWHNLEQLLVEHEYLLRDRVIDLIGKESWLND
jgi:hypothetical protein